MQEYWARKEIVGIAWFRAAQSEGKKKTKIKNKYILIDTVRSGTRNTEENNI